MIGNYLEDPQEAMQGKKFLKLDMDKVAEVDDMVILNENEFEESTISADEYKEELLKTNLIINKRSSSFGGSAKRTLGNNLIGSHIAPA